MRSLKSSCSRSVVTISSAPSRDYELLRSFPHFDSLPAARNDQIYVVDAGAYFARPGPRIVDSLEILAGILHPAEFPEFAPDAGILSPKCCLRVSKPGA